MSGEPLHSSETNVTHTFTVSPNSLFVVYRPRNAVGRMRCCLPIERTVPIVEILGLRRLQCDLVAIEPNQFFALGERTLD